MGWYPRHCEKARDKNREKMLEKHASIIDIAKDAIIQSGIDERVSGNLQYLLPVAYPAHVEMNKV